MHVPYTATLVEPIRRTVEKLAPEARRILLAVSGGSDSVALLRALHGAERYDLHVAHLDHAIRDDSAEDATWVEALCQRLHLPITVERIDVPEAAREQRGNLEDVARTIRYAFLTRVAKTHACDVVATAHTRNDQAETVLMQLLRGSAHPRGIEPSLGRVIRPLLDHSKDDLRGYLDSIDQPWRDDRGNRDVTRDRAWIRHEVLPKLERRRPGATVRLARFGHTQRDQADLLEEEARRRFGTAALPRDALQRAPFALQREALNLMVRRAGGTVSGVHLDALLDALPGRDLYRRDLPGNVRVRMLPRTVDAFAIQPSVPKPAWEGRAIDTPESLPEGAPTALLEDGPLVQRTPKPGDRIRLHGGRRTVADLLGEHGVPRESRATWPILARGDDVVWIKDVAVEAGIDADEADPDRRFMRRALELAREAAERGEVPIGAVLVRDGHIIGEGANARERRHDPSAHAEILAMRAAAEHDDDWRLQGATLYVTLEPCPMCAGAVLETHLDRLVWGADNPRDGALGSVVDLSAGPFKRVPALRRGVLAAEAERLLQDTFEERR